MSENVTGDTPPTPDQVTEALKFAAISTTAEVSTLAAAARDWLRIQEEAETIWWCEEHRAVKDAPSYPGCRESMRLQPVHYFKPCCMVERRLI